MDAHRFLPLVVVLAVAALGITSYLALPAFNRASAKSTKLIELQQLLNHRHGDIHHQAASEISAAVVKDAADDDAFDAALNVFDTNDGPADSKAVDVASKMLALERELAVEHANRFDEEDHTMRKVDDLTKSSPTKKTEGALPPPSIHEPTTDIERFGVSWIKDLPLEIRQPPKADSIDESKLLSVQEFMSDPTLKAVQQLDEVPKEWRTVGDISTKLEVPYCVVRDTASVDVKETEDEWQAAIAQGKPKTVRSKSCSNPDLVKLAKDGKWKHGSIESINASEWPFATNLFSKAYILQVPYSFVGDNHVFGSSAPNDKRLHFGMNRFWMTPGLGNAKRCYGPSTRRSNQTAWARVDDLGAVAISAESWQGDHFQHFVLDTLPRLSMLYDQLVNPNLTSSQSFLKDAKIVFNRGPAPTWFMETLGLTDRLIDGISWCIKTEHLYRARLALYPEYHQVPIAQDPNPSARHGVYPRGSLAPIQKKLGVWLDTRWDRIVYIKRAGARSLRCDIEEAIIEGIRARLARTSASLDVVELKYNGKQEDSLAQMRRALMVFGVHGGGMANAVFCKPGTAFVEIMPIRIMHTLKHRTSKYCYYGLAQAAGLDYYTVEPPFFGWGHPNIDPDPRDILDILEHVLKQHGYI